MRLEFSGVVTVGNSARTCCDESDGAIHVDGVDIVDAIYEESWSESVKVILNGEEIANGKCVTRLGWGHSEYTPIDDDVVIVGNFDLLERLEKLNGQKATLLVEDDNA